MDRPGFSPGASASAFVRSSSSRSSAAALPTVDLVQHSLKGCEVPEVEGIHSVTPVRLKAWQQDGVVPKLVGRITCENGLLTAGVGISTYPPSDPFAHVRGKDKAIRIRTDAMGETIAIGAGKEPLATAAAALKDLEHILAARSAAPRTTQRTSS